MSKIYACKLLILIKFLPVDLASAYHVVKNILSSKNTGTRKSIEIKTMSNLMNNYSYFAPVTLSTCMS